MTITKEQFDIAIELINIASGWGISDEDIFKAYEICEDIALLRSTVDEMAYGKTPTTELERFIQPLVF